MYQIDVENLLKSGAHFGHPTSKWNPKFKKYIVAKKNGIHIIDLQETQRALDKACRKIVSIVQASGNVLFVGTKKQAQVAIQEAADKCGMYYVVERWLGGTLTNFATIKKSIRRLISLEKESGELYASLTKKEITMMDRERIKLADLHRGIKDMKHLPAALFIVDGNFEQTAIKEAKRLGIPTFGIIDSNTDPGVIDFPIPANDDSIRTIQLIAETISNAIIEAKGGSATEVEEVSTLETKDEVVSQSEKNTEDSNKEIVKEVQEVIVKENKE
ncbi:MAG: 30S ribosomal protein S2 [Candidatus Marinimicrobia bacterium]|nr:30S ribosomal protein S2 [Candidatus Neomarinimicrobiota bacterium]